MITTITGEITPQEREFIDDCSQSCEVIDTRNGVEIRGILSDTAELQLQQRFGNRITIDLEGASSVTDQIRTSFTL